MEIPAAKDEKKHWLDESIETWWYQINLQGTSPQIYIYIVYIYYIIDCVYV